ncbi:MAG: VOC family protein [Gammaproteobacteria bacterium]|nr:VOC family protein [Gammaproteobacteria bacterium]
MRRGIDHLVLCVADLERAVAFYRRLGFTTTPRAQHAWGTDNSLVQLDGCFLELLTLARPERVSPPSRHTFSFGAFNRDFLAGGEGMSMLVFESSDARADREQLVESGLHPWEVFDFERAARLPDGSSVRVAFSLAFATDPRMPQVAFFYCQQHAPQYFWKPEYQRHENGARVVVEVLMEAPEPHALRDFFVRLQDDESVQVVDGGLEVSTPRGRLAVLSPEALARRPAGALPAAHAGSARFIGYSVAVADREHAARILSANDVAFEEAGDALRISPEHAFGVTVELVEQGGVPP